MDVMVDSPVREMDILYSRVAFTRPSLTFMW